MMVKNFDKDIELISISYKIEIFTESIEDLRPIQKQLKRLGLKYEISRVKNY